MNELVMIILGFLMGCVVTVSGVIILIIQNKYTKDSEMFKEQQIRRLIIEISGNLIENHIKSQHKKED